MIDERGAYDVEAGAKVAEDAGLSLVKCALVLAGIYSAALFCLGFILGRFG